MGELVIEIGCTGIAEALHMDDFDLSFLGDKKITRQTEIIFNEDGQYWQVSYLCAGQATHAISGFPSYTKAREFEVAWINECRLLGIPPMTAEGFDIAISMREQYV